jgi:hypothetical protein
MYGWKDGLWYVNSGTGLSRDLVTERFPETTDRDGALTRTELEDELGQSINGTIVGSISIRDALEQGRSKRTAHKILNAGIASGLVHQSPRDIHFASITELDQLLRLWQKPRR